MGLNKVVFQDVSSILRLKLCEVPLVILHFKSNHSGHGKAGVLSHLHPLHLEISAISISVSEISTLQMEVSQNGGSPNP